MKQHAQNTNAKLGFNPCNKFEIPFSIDTFVKIFGSHLYLDQQNRLPIKLRLSIDDLNKSLGAPCDKIVSPDSCTQERIFGPVDICFYEKICKSFDNSACKR